MKHPQRNLFPWLSNQIPHLYVSQVKLNQQYCYQFLNTRRTKQRFLNSVAKLSNLTRLTSALWHSNMRSVLLKLHSYLDMATSFMLRRWMIRQALTKLQSKFSLPTRQFFRYALLLPIVTKTKRSLTVDEIVYDKCPALKLGSKNTIYGKEYNFILNLLKPTSYVMHQQFNIQQL